ncbi:MAG: preQ(1) synthase [Smithellaceae bacterium]|nr:preQ(1) synthase [Smithellaceae bacterium]
MKRASKKTSEYVPAYLGKQSSRPVAKVDLIPWDGAEITVSLECREFTSLCPVTSQPHFGEILITYAPDQHLIESKSLKLYLWRYRDVGVFSESLVARIADDLCAQVKPKWIEVEGTFQSRGGIAIGARVRRPG